MLTIKETANRLGIHPQSVHWLIQEKRISARPATSEEIAELLTGKRIKGVPPGGISLVDEAEAERYIRERRKPGSPITKRQGDLRQCSSCREWLPLSAFGKMKTYWDGLNYRCKVCNVAKTKAQKEKQRAAGVYPPRNPPSDEPKRCNKCEEVKPAVGFGISRNNPDGRNNTCRVCRKKEAHPNHYAANRAYMQRNPDKRRARYAVRDAVKYGKIPPASTLPCAGCGAQAAHYHHHRGYAKEYRLDVIPLCVVCHGAADLR